MDPPTRHRCRTAVLAAVALAAIGAFVTPERAGAGTEPPSGEPVLLDAGPWSGVGEAAGRAVGTERGVTVSWDGVIPAEFEFTVSIEDPDGRGEVFGTWRHGGSATMELTLAAFPDPVVASLVFSGGGAVSGSNAELLLSGSSRTTGSWRVNAGGQTVSGAVDNTSTLPPLELEIWAVSCNQAFGHWVYTVEQAFQDEGFRTSFDGFWVASRNIEDVSEALRDALAALSGSLPGSPDIQGPNEFTTYSTALLATYNALVDSFPDGWNIESVIDLASAAEALLNTWKNLTGCDRDLFGEGNVETFVSGLTFAIQGLIIGGSQLAGLTSSAWAHLAHLGVRTGAFGAGAENPAQAVSAEQALIDAGEAILAANVDPSDGRIFVNDDTTRVMATGAAMGWDYTVNGKVYDAREAYETTMGEPAAPIDGGEGDG